MRLIPEIKAPGSPLMSHFLCGVRHVHTDGMVKPQKRCHVSWKGDCTIIIKSKDEKLTGENKLVLKLIVI